MFQEDYSHTLCVLFSVAKSHHQYYFGVGDACMKLMNRGEFKYDMIFR